MQILYDFQWYEMQKFNLYALSLMKILEALECQLTYAKPNVMLMQERYRMIMHSKSELWCSKCRFTKMKQLDMGEMLSYGLEHREKPTFQLSHWKETLEISMQRRKWSCNMAILGDVCKLMGVHHLDRAWKEKCNVRCNA